MAISVFSDSSLVIYSKQKLLVIPTKEGSGCLLSSMLAGVESRSLVPRDDKHHSFFFSNNPTIRH